MISAAGGRTRWTQRVRAGTANQPAIVTGQVYVGADDGVYGFDLPSGRTAFRPDGADLPAGRRRPCSG
jgi:outer membrane protein assembly factor BamB